MAFPRITLEEHWFSSSVSDDMKGWYSEQFKHNPDVLDKLYDVGPLRLQSMLDNHIALQIISHAPGLTTSASPISDCRAANDELASRIAASAETKRRFVGFAVLPLGDPDASAAELGRCVKDLKFAGALVDNHVDGRFFDGDEYNIVWRTAVELDVPIYLHPVWPATKWAPFYEGNFGSSAALSMGASGWGWHVEAGLHVLRLFAAGVFDRHPQLKIIIGHMGEMLPFFLERVCSLSTRWGERKRKFKEVYEENVWITTSGVWSVHPLRCILGNTPLDHILYSVDYPFQKNETGAEWWDELEKSGLCDKEQLEGIAYRNAEKLLKVTAPRE